MDQALACGSKMSTAALHAPVDASAPTAKRTRPKGNALRGGSEAEAAAEREAESAACDHKQVLLTGDTRRQQSMGLVLEDNIWRVP